MAARRSDLDLLVADAEFARILERRRAAPSSSPNPSLSWSAVVMARLENRPRLLLPGALFTKGRRGDFFLIVGPCRQEVPLCCLPVQGCVCVCGVCVCVCVYTCMYIYIGIYIHRYIHIYVLIYTHRLHLTLTWLLPEAARILSLPKVGSHRVREREGGGPRGRTPLGR